ncbi:MAG: HNH endonuclease [Plectolyngbya sp. WJT66-NPBG17]|jgi:hypothetical protein|nr:HNH endonuclease [Plectolyngbya sp. WJT66-NPBG17]
MNPYISVELQRRVRVYFANLCAYCKTAEALTATTFEIEHINPRALGGETVFENLCLACPFCNRHKATRQTAIDPLTQEEFPLFHPHQEDWAEHFTWSEQSDEILGLTEIGRATITALKMNREALVKVRRLWIQLDEHPPAF